MVNHDFPALHKLLSFASDVLLEQGKYTNAQIHQLILDAHLELGKFEDLLAETLPLLPRVSTPGSSPVVS
jgi:hypothetical protein